MADYLLGLVATAESPQIEQSGIQNNMYLYFQVESTSRAPAIADMNWCLWKTQ